MKRDKLKSACDALSVEARHSVSVDSANRGSAEQTDEDKRAEDSQSHDFYRIEAPPSWQRRLFLIGAASYLLAAALLGFGGPK